MLEQLISSLKSDVGGQIASETKLPSGTMDKVFSVIGDVTKKEVTNQMTGGNISNVMNLFSNKPNNKDADSLQSNITSGVISDLTSKLGISSDMSAKIASIAIPALISMISSKNSSTPDDDPSPLNDIFGSVVKSQLKSGGVKSILGKFFSK